MEHFIAEYGYWAIFLGCAFQGITILFVGGLIAHHGELDFTLMLAVGMVGTLLLEGSFYMLGSISGRKLLHRWPRAQHTAEKVHHWLEKWPFGFMLLYRYLPGGQSVVASAIGASGFERLKFWVLDPISAILNGFVLAGAGYLFGHLLVTLWDDARGYEIPIAVGIAVVVIAALWIWHILAERHHNRRAREEAAGQPPDAGRD